MAFPRACRQGDVRRSFRGHPRVVGVGLGLEACRLLGDRCSLLRLGGRRAADRPRRACGPPRVPAMLLRRGAEPPPARDAERRLPRRVLRPPCSVRLVLGALLALRLAPRPPARRVVALLFGPLSCFVSVAACSSSARCCSSSSRRRASCSARCRASSSPLRAPLRPSARFLFGALSLFVLASRASCRASSSARWRASSSARCRSSSSRRRASCSARCRASSSMRRRASASTRCRSSSAASDPLGLLRGEPSFLGLRRLGEESDLLRLGVGLGLDRCNGVGGDNPGALLFEQPQLDAPDLAAARLRQLVDELDLPRVLVRCSHASAVLLKRACQLVARLEARLQYDECFRRSGRGRDRASRRRRSRRPPDAPAGRSRPRTGRFGTRPTG